MMAKRSVWNVLLALCFCFLASHAVVCLADDSPSFDQATYVLVESIPVGVDLETNMTTGEAWLDMINSATRNLNLALFYMSLTNSSQWPEQDGGAVGLAVYNALINAAARGVRIRIAMNPPMVGMSQADAIKLNESGVAEVRFVPWVNLFGNGVLHTKLLIADDHSYYLGSANADWTSLTQVKELGIYVRHSYDTTSDLQKLFDQYWILTEVSAVPEAWPNRLDTHFNIYNPMPTRLNDTSLSLFFAYSPPQFYVPDRTYDADAIVMALESAQEFFCLEVMDYLPATAYYVPNFYWATIDTAIRTAAFRGVKVEMLIAKWNYSMPTMVSFLNSLAAVPNVTVRLFEVPDMPGQSQQIPFTRVNHAKYFVTDKIVYIGTSNWVGDYFLDTGGVSVTINSEMIRLDALWRFQRDWNSQYAHPVTVTSNQS
eukprot:TRINITY_DN1014_c0_g1_i1.p1 TRINITY_DN1014_c0_g1~~TRINITY_DN1014_c0_g1_i1.p1  ORF type:complete len:428 (-),score=80.53 TRINITY_DN1014_c0_g1_i1:269-1552(-)